MKLQPQAALEQAAVDLIRALPERDGIPGNYSSENCNRELDGRPPPGSPHCYVAVWSDNARQSKGRTVLDETYHFFITITLRQEMIYDRRTDLRDEMEIRGNDIRAELHKDSIDYRLIRAAMLLAGLTWITADSSPIGWVEASMFSGMDPIQPVGPDWFQGKPDSAEVGISQRLRFDMARWMQAILTEE